MEFSFENIIEGTMMMMMQSPAERLFSALPELPKGAHRFVISKFSLVSEVKM